MGFLSKDRCLYTVSLALSLLSIYLHVKCSHFLCKTYWWKPEAGWMLAACKLLFSKALNLSVRHFPRLWESNNGVSPDRGSSKVKQVDVCKELGTHSKSKGSVATGGHSANTPAHICSHLLPPTEPCAYARWAVLPVKPFCANCVCFAFIPSKHQVKAIK